MFGLVGAFFLRQTLQAQLYETGAMDPRVVAAVAAMLIAVALDRVRVAGEAGREDRSVDCAERPVSADRIGRVTPLTIAAFTAVCLGVAVSSAARQRAAGSPRDEGS